MYLEKLSLKSFRCFEGASFHFSPEVNLFIGENGAGKSSILEAIHLLSTGQSFRTRKPEHLVREREAKSGASLSWNTLGIPQELSWVFEGQGAFFFNRKRLKKSSAVIGILPTVTLTPNDGTLMTGGPDERRSFLDLILSQLDPLYLHHRIRYETALKRRNENLKHKKIASLDGLEHEMGKSAHYLIRKREEITLELKQIGEPLFSFLIGEKTSFDITYKSSHHLEKHWKEDRSKELILGYTLQGPHRDDLIFLARGKEIRLFGSEGEKKTFLLSIKLAHHQILKNHTQTTPLLLLDDLTASLDKERISRWSKLMSGWGQIIVTSTSKDPLKQEKGVHIQELRREREDHVLNV